MKTSSKEISKNWDLCQSSRRNAGKNWLISVTLVTILLGEKVSEAIFSTRGNQLHCPRRKPFALQWPRLIYKTFRQESFMVLLALCQLTSTSYSYKIPGGIKVEPKVHNQHSTERITSDVFIFLDNVGNRMCTLTGASGCEHFPPPLFIQMPKLVYINSEPSP